MLAEPPVAALAVLWLLLCSCLPSLGLGWAECQTPGQVPWVPAAVAGETSGGAQQSLACTAA
jgi:hypothetical protein